MVLSATFNLKTAHLTGLPIDVGDEIRLTFEGMTGVYKATLTDDSAGEILGSINFSQSDGNQALYKLPYVAHRGTASLSITSSMDATGDVVVHAGVPHYTIMPVSVVANVCNNESYRYGYNGQMKVNEIVGEGNHLDFGARMYDCRLGRTPSLDPEGHQYPMMSPYSGLGNNPIMIRDPDGKLLRDASGNLIVVATGKVETKTIYTGAYADRSKTQPILITYTFQDAYIVANNGKHIKAQMVSSQQFLVSSNGQEARVNEQSAQMLSSNLDASSNCHGVTVANGQLNIFSEDIGKELMDEKEFKTTSQAEAGVVVFTDDKGKVTHSAKKNGNTYTVGDGATKTRQGDKNTASVNGKYQNPHYKKEVVKTSSTMSSGGSTNKKGTRVYSEAEYKKKGGR